MKEYKLVLAGFAPLSPTCAHARLPRIPECLRGVKRPESSNDQPTYFYSSRLQPFCIYGTREVEVKGKVVPVLN
jgi:hypothetical protein